MRGVTGRQRPGVSSHGLRGITGRQRPGVSSHGLRGITGRQRPGVSSWIEGDNWAPTSWSVFTWIEGDNWAPKSWSVFGQSIRTNDDCEGYHGRLNHRGKTLIPLYMLIELLNREAAISTLSDSLVSENKLRRHLRKDYRRQQDQFF